MEQNLIFTSVSLIILEKYAWLYVTAQVLSFKKGGEVGIILRFSLVEAHLLKKKKLLTSGHLSVSRHWPDTPYRKANL